MCATKKGGTVESVHIGGESASWCSDMEAKKKISGKVDI